MMKNLLMEETSVDYILYSSYMPSKEGCIFSIGIYGVDLSATVA